MAYPELVPTSRAFDPGNWPIKTFRSQNGAELRMLYGSRRTGMSLSLSYQNITDADAQLFLTHFDQCQGTFATFSLPANTATKRGWVGTQDAMGAGATGNRWRYNEPPKIESVRPGRSSVTVALVGVF